MRDDSVSVNVFDSTKRLILLSEIAFCICNKNTVLA